MYAIIIWHREYNKNIHSEEIWSGVIELSILIGLDSGYLHFLSM
jgi:hypothetical protein